VNSELDLKVSDELVSAVARLNGIQVAGLERLLATEASTNHYVPRRVLVDSVDEIRGDKVTATDARMQALTSGVTADSFLDGYLMSGERLLAQLPYECVSTMLLDNMHERTGAPKTSGKGKLYLTSARIVFVSSDSSVNGDYMPLATYQATTQHAAPGLAALQSHAKVLRAKVQAARTRNASQVRSRFTSAFGFSNSSVDSASNSESQQLLPADNGGSMSGSITVSGSAPTGKSGGFLSGLGGLASKASEFANAAKAGINSRLGGPGNSYGTTIPSSASAAVGTAPVQAPVQESGSLFSSVDSNVSGPRDAAEARDEAELARLDSEIADLEALNPTTSKISQLSDVLLMLREPPPPLIIVAAPPPPPVQFVMPTQAPREPQPPSESCSLVCCLKKCPCYLCFECCCLPKPCACCCPAQSAPSVHPVGPPPPQYMLPPTEVTTATSNVHSQYVVHMSQSSSFDVYSIPVERFLTARMSWNVAVSTAGALDRDDCTTTTTIKGGGQPTRSNSETVTQYKVSDRAVPLRKAEKQIFLDFVVLLPPWQQRAQMKLRLSAEATIGSLSSFLALFHQVAPSYSVHQLNECHGIQALRSDIASK
jgi:hypothetical protein